MHLKKKNYRYSKICNLYMEKREMKPGKDGGVDIWEVFILKEEKLSWKEENVDPDITPEDSTPHPIQERRQQSV